MCCVVFWHGHLPVGVRLECEHGYQTVGLGVNTCPCLPHIMNIRHTTARHWHCRGYQAELISPINNPTKSASRASVAASACPPARGQQHLPLLLC